ncbi:MAG: DUF5009 domain-containing protein, partial [Candidatus Acidiferrum sp.]
MTAIIPPRRIELDVKSPMAGHAPSARPPRLVSLDAFRGATMLFMASEGLALNAVAHRFPKDPLWQTLAFHADNHVVWLGCSLWDLIQPSFMFMVGVAMPFSYAARQARGDSAWKTVFHVLTRSFILIALGIFLRSKYSAQTNFTFEDVLAQIGLGYPFVYLVLGRGWRVQIAALLCVLVGYWAYFVWWPLPAEGFDYAAVGLTKGPLLTDFFGHWNKNTNAA